MAEASSAARREQPMANIVYGAQDMNMPDVVGKTVAEVRAYLSSPLHGWNIPADATAKMDKQDLDESHVVQPGEKIVFFRRLGEKGI